MHVLYVLNRRNDILRLICYMRALRNVMLRHVYDIRCVVRGVPYVFILTLLNVEVSFYVFFTFL